VLVLEKLVIAEQVLLREVRSAVILRRRVSMASRTRTTTTTISAASQPSVLAPAADQTDHNALNDQFLGGDQIGIQRVLGL
jgi:hypothetical protein